MSASESKDYILKSFKPARKTTNENLIRTCLEFCDKPTPQISFEGRSFCLTGNFEFENGDRNKCENAVRVRGGTCVQRPNHSTDYVVIGTFVEPAWAHKGYGRKIEIAVELKQYGSKCKLVSEAEWIKALQNSPELPKEKQISTIGQPRNLQVEHLQQALDETQKNQKAMLEILRKKLKASDYQKISKLFQKSGIVIPKPVPNSTKRKSSA